VITKVYPDGRALVKLPNGESVEAVIKIPATDALKVEGSPIAPNAESWVVYVVCAENNCYLVNSRHRAMKKAGPPMDHLMYISDTPRTLRRIIDVWRENKAKLKLNCWIAEVVSRSNLDTPPPIPEGLRGRVNSWEGQTLSVEFIETYMKIVWRNGYRGQYLLFMFRSEGKDDGRVLSVNADVWKIEAERPVSFKLRLKRMLKDAEDTFTVWSEGRDEPLWLTRLHAPLTIFTPVALKNPEPGSLSQDVLKRLRMLGLRPALS